ncbi:MAG: Gfo/Idh/MocA family oxidoreductase [Opitutaceae bacterium]|nr:Gfo/Idh/MocA family oxidoreductase [Opitutaceae bacterium]
MNQIASSLFSRRDFLKTGAAASALAVAPMILPSRLFGQNAPSKQLGVGFIGVGNIAQGHLDTLLGFPEVRIRAVSDVDRRHRDFAKNKVDAGYAGKDCAAYNDFREMLARPDIDLVWVCTPDHWHALAAIHAIRAGKDVYVEKPLTLTITEGRELVNALRRHQRVGQTGTQQRSTKRFHDTAEFIRNGGLGKLQHIEVLIPANNKYTTGTWKAEPVPEGLDWEMWLGPAPFVPFNRQGCHYNFRFNLNYAAGQVTNWGVHYIDIAQWALGADDSGPVEVEGKGEFPTTGLFSTATKVDFTCKYANGVTLRCHTRYDGVGDGNVRYFGERGWVDVSRSANHASNPDFLKEITAQAGKGAVKLTVSTNHHDNFLNAVRTRTKPISDLEIGHRTTTVCNLGNIAMQLGRKLRWDPARESFIDDPMADRMRHRSMRGPWGLV